MNGDAASRARCPIGIAHLNSGRATILLTENLFCQGLDKLLVANNLYAILAYRLRLVIANSIVQDFASPAC